MSSFDLTSYYAKRIIGDSAATNSGSALLQSGVNDSMWIFGHNRGNYGIKYLYVGGNNNSTEDKIEFHSGNENTDTVTAWIQLDTGDASFHEVTGDLKGNADTATEWATAQKVYVTLGTASTSTTIKGGSSSAQTIGVNGKLGVGNGGTGCDTLTSGSALIGNGTSAVTFRAITNNTSATAVTASTNLITANTLYYHKGNSNIVTVGTITSGTWNGTTIAVAKGGTGCETLTSGSALIGNGTDAVTLRAITNNTTAGSNPTANTNLITANTLINYKGTTNIDTVGTITSGTWNGTAIAAAYIGNHSTSKLTSGTLGVTRGGTGCDTLTSGSALIGNGTDAVTFRGIRNNTSLGSLGWTKAATDITLVTTNTIAYWNGQYKDGSSNLKYLGTVEGGTWQASTIQVAYGGTGTSTAPTQWGIIYASSTSAYASTSAGAAGQVLIGQGTGTNKAPIWYGGLTLSGAGTSASPYTITLSGATTITGHLSMKINDTVDITQANNGISDNDSRVIMYTDKNGRYVARTYGRANTSGSCTLFLHAGNYYNSGQKYEGISITLDKEGNCTYGVSDPANFRSTIGLGTAATHAHGDYALSSHTHGNITNAGALQTTDITIASGDKIVVTDSSDSSKIARTSIAFDASTTNQCLTKKGTWEEFNNYSHPTTAGNKHIPSGGSTGQFLKYSSSGTATWSDLPEASSSTAGIVLLGATDGAATYGHTHGNITNAGALQTTDITLASGDKLVVTDSSNSNKVARASISFDGSTATKCLTQKGTWEDFNNYSHPTTAGNKHIPSGGSTGQFLKYSAAGTAAWSALPDATSSVAGITLLGASGGAATYDHTHSTYLALAAGNTSIVTGNIFIRSAETKGTTVTSTTNRMIIFLEANGTATKNRIGYINAYQPANTTNQRIGLVAYKHVADSTASTYFYLAYDSDDTKRTYTDALIYGAVWNDYAEFRTTNKKAIPGQVVIDKDDGSLEISSTRLQSGASVVSDTFGFAIGETEKAKTPLAVSGRVLAYTYRPREEYHAGMAVCSAPNGTIDIMTREEIRDYPDAIVGIVSEIPEYKVWGQKSIKVDNRIWIKVR